MKIKIQRYVTYIPEWNKNKGDEENPVPAEVQVVVKIKHLTTEEFDSCYTISPQILNEKGVKIGGGGVTVDRRKMFLITIISLKNLTTEDESGTEKEIKTPQDVLDTPGLEDLYFELIAFVRGLESRIDSKN